MLFTPVLMPAIRKEAFANLRARIRGAAPGSRHGVMPFGDPRIDKRLLEGGLTLGQLHEISAAGIEAETGAAAGFLACLLACLMARFVSQRPVFWISPIADLHAPGLVTYGVDPNRIVFVRSDGDATTLSAMETALQSSAIAVVGEVGRLDRTPSQRLQMACIKRGGTGFVLRRWPCKRLEMSEATVSATRWSVAPAPTFLDHDDLGPSRWQVSLTHARGGTEGSWILEISILEIQDREMAVDAASATRISRVGPAYPFRVVAELANAAAASSPVPADSSKRWNSLKLAS